MTQTLSNEKIDALWREATTHHGDTTREFVRWFAREVAALASSSSDKQSQDTAPAGKATTCPCMDPWKTPCAGPCQAKVRQPAATPLDPAPSALQDQRSDLSPFWAKMVDFMDRAEAEGCLDGLIKLAYAEQPQHAEPTPVDASHVSQAQKKFTRFDNVSCSQCGGDFGPGNEGFSHCADHADRVTTPAIDSNGFAGFLCKSWIANDLPCAEVVSDLDGVHRFVEREWVPLDDVVDANALMDVIKAHDFVAAETWFATGNAGGVSVQAVRVYGSPAPDEAIACADQIETETLEILHGTRKPGKLSVEPIVRLCAYVRTGSVHNATPLRDAKARAVAKARAEASAGAPITRCQSSRDGDCRHAQCPQLRDGEPQRSGRHCPLDTQGSDE